MDSSQILSLLEELDDNIDDIEDALAPFLEKTVPEVASKLPLLDKAKLYTLVTYAIESILFSYLRLNGINAREHAVFTELTRVKQYFQKIDAAENPVAEKSNLKLDKGAAGRFIKAGLSGNDKYDLQRAEREAKERARSHIKFAELSKKRKVDGDGATPNEQKTGSSEHSDDSSSDSDSPAPESASAVPSSKKRKTGEVSQEVQTTSPDEALEQPKSKSRSKKPKQEGKEKKNQKSKKKKNKN